MVNGAKMAKYNKNYFGTTGWMSQWILLLKILKKSILEVKIGDIIILILRKMKEISMA